MSKRTINKPCPHCGKTVAIVVNDKDIKKPKAKTAKKKES